MLPGNRSDHGVKTVVVSFSSPLCWLSGIFSQQVGVRAQAFAPFGWDCSHLHGKAGKLSAIYGQLLYPSQQRRPIDPESCRRSFRASNSPSRLAKRPHDLLALPTCESLRPRCFSRGSERTGTLSNETEQDTSGRRWAALPPFRRYRPATRGRCQSTAASLRLPQSAEVRTRAPPSRH